MLVIGLTGGIASGKSTVSRMLTDLGARVIDADRIAREVVQPGAEAYAGVVEAFGAEILLADGTIDRGGLGKKVFGNREALDLLGSLTHPHIRRRVWNGVAAARDEGLPAVVVDMPLLIEVGQYKKMDRVWLIYVDRETQRQRLMARDGFSLADAEARVRSQLPLDEKRAYAHAVIDNQGTLAETRAQVERLWAEVLESA